MAHIIRTDFHEALIQELLNNPDLIERPCPGQFKYKDIKITAFEVFYKDYKINEYLIVPEVFEQCCLSVRKSA